MMNGADKHKLAGETLRAPTGSTLSCKGWEQEAALRMLLNSVDPDVAEHSDNSLSVSDGASRLRATLAALRDLESDASLVFRSGQPAGVFRTNNEAPRVIVIPPGRSGEDADSYGNWLSVGTQTRLPIAYEAFASAARKYFGGTLAGRLITVCGLGTAGGAMPLAATLNGAAVLGIDVDAEQIKRRVKTGYCEVMVNDLDEALRILKNGVRKHEPASVGLIGNCAELIPELAQRGIVPDLMLDCTLGDALFSSYIPRGLSAAKADELRQSDAGAYRDKTLESIEAQEKGTLELQRLGSRTYRMGSDRESGNQKSNISDWTAEFIAPLLNKSCSLLLWVALSGEPADISRADRLALEVFASDAAAIRFLQLAARHVQFQGIPARVCLVDRALASKFGAALNEMVAQHTLRAPILIGCQDISEQLSGFSSHPIDERRGGSLDESQFKTVLASLSPQAKAASWVASALERRTEPKLNLAIVADGTAKMARRIARVLGGE